MISIYKLQNVSPYCLIKQVNKILGIRNLEIWLFDDVSKMKKPPSKVADFRFFWYTVFKILDHCVGIHVKNKFWPKDAEVIKCSSWFQWPILCPGYPSMWQMSLSQVLILNKHHFFTVLNLTN